MSSAMYTLKAKAYSNAIKNNVFNAHFERPSLQALLPALKGKQVLDLGAGPGEYADYLLQQQARVVAVDKSAEMVSLLRERFINQTDLKAIQGDALDALYQLDEQDFDLVISPLCLHYVKDIESVFAQIFRVLKPGGLLVFSTHHPMVDYPDSVSGNYFDTEYLTQTWNTLEEDTQVSFYRRPLQDWFLALQKAGLVTLGISEGAPSEALKNTAPDLYTRLKTQPQFIFFKCQKPG